MRRSIWIPAALAAAALTAVLWATGVRSDGDGDIRSLPALLPSSETAEPSNDGDGVSDTAEPSDDGDGAPGTAEPSDDGDGAPGTAEPSDDGDGAPGTAEPSDDGDSVPAAEKPSVSETPEPAAQSAETTEPVTKPAETAEPVTKPPETAEPVTKPPETPKPSAQPAETPKPVTKPAETTEPVTNPPETTEAAADSGDAAGSKLAETPEAGSETPDSAGTADSAEGGAENDMEIGGLDAGPIDITMERPPFDGHYLCPSLTGTTETAVPVALVLRADSGGADSSGTDEDGTDGSESDEGRTEDSGSSAREWMEAHWTAWMEDPRFAAEQNPAPHIITNQDQRYTYIADNESFWGQGVTIYDNATLEPAFFVDLFAYLFQDNASAAGSDGTDAQSLRWARLLGGRLFFSNASSLSAEKMGGRNGYLTAIDPWTGQLLWRTDPLVCCTANFEVPGPADGSGGVLLCGGPAGQGGFLYQVGMKTGEVLDRTPLDSPPEWIVCADGAAFVHCADRDYVFDMYYS